MKFTETKLKGALIVDLEPRQEYRFFLARIFCAKEFADDNIKPAVVQCSVS